MQRTREDMLKKIDAGKNFITKNPQLFRCPLCHSSMNNTAYSLCCDKGHRFDLSKKGTLFFLKQGHNTEYSKEMFLPRGKLIRAGMYQPVIDQILEWLDPDQPLLDVGCGEGSFLFELQKQQAIKPSIGFDISKEGIYLASNQPVDSFWCVADLTNLPFADQSMGTILNIFTPSHYQEFQRVLKDDGVLIKVIPESRYLQELRQAFFPEEAAKQTYTNVNVHTNLDEKMKIVAEKRVSYVFKIPEALRLSLLEMSPLEWSVTKERKAFLQKNPLSEITVDVNVIQAKKF